MTPRLALLALATAALLTGCSRPEANEAAPPTASCADVGQASLSAPLVATLQEDPEQMAARMGDAMGTPVSGPPDPREDGALVWQGGDATVTVVRSEEDVRIAWERDAPWTPTRDEAEATLRRVLQAFAPPDADTMRIVETSPGDLFAEQSYAGRSLVGAGASLTSGAYAHVEVHGLREVRPGLDVMSEENATDIATRAVRCALDQDGRTEEKGHALQGTDPAALGVKGNSLAWLVNVRVAEPEGPSHCGHVERAYVDALTGKVIGIERPPCD